jgi:hypothetical protein
MNKTNDGAEPSLASAGSQEPVAWHPARAIVGQNADGSLVFVDSWNATNKRSGENEPAATRPTLISEARNAVAYCLRRCERHGLVEWVPLFRGLLKRFT